MLKSAKKKKKNQNKIYKFAKNRMKQTNVPGFFNTCVYAKQKINLTWPKDLIGGDSTVPHIQGCQWDPHDSTCASRGTGKSIWSVIDRAGKITNFTENYTDKKIFFSQDSKETYS